MGLSKAYEASKYESDIYKLWDRSRVFMADPNSTKAHFSMAMPPPNETGSLHVGHALFLTLQDILARHEHQKGKDVLWLPGTDHAALATNAIIEKRLTEQGTDKHAVGREEFIRLVKEFVGNSRESINSQIRAMGASCDWSRTRYTLDEALNRCVNEVFVKMYNDGLIYRGHRIVNWDPKLGTTVSDDEVIYKEQKAPFYTLQYGPFKIGTARPETKFGDKYIVMHPDDKRYKHYKHGDTFEADWINGQVTATVIKDEAVDPSFGTGVMTITPWHDRTDFEIAERHGLEKEQIIGFDGRLLPIAHEFAGQTIEAARPKIIAKLKAKGLLIKEAEYTHNVALNDRGKGVIEPQIKLQWFVDVNRPAVEWKGQLRSLREVMHAVIEDGDIKIMPKRFEKVYYHWIDNLRDWCISRQIWWGHQVPVWYKQLQQPMMGFDQTVMNQMFKGKTKTYRQKDYGYKVGDKILVENSQTGVIFGEITLKAVQKTTVGKVNLADKAHYVTYKNQAELIAALKKYHPERKMDADYPIWVYEYDFEPKEVEPEIYVGVTPPQGRGWEQDPDTLDTWFSSALWTWSTLVDQDLAKDYSLSLEDLLAKSVDYRTYHPTDVMETGWDILFFWVARMILATTYITGEVPFKTVYLHGLVRTEEGKKMSKSDLDSIVDPMEIIPEYGTDALRLALVAGTTAGNDQRVGKTKILANRNFCNKLWNIARYIDDLRVRPVDPLRVVPLGREMMPKSVADHWILDKLSIFAQRLDKALAGFRFSEAYELLYHFVWDDLADWYIEASKVQPNPALLRKVLEDTLKLAHPFMPFITETIWQNLGKKSLLAAELAPEIIKADKAQARQFEELKKIITEARQIATNVGVSQPALLYTNSDIIERGKELVKRLGRLGEVEKTETGRGIRLMGTKAAVWLDIDHQKARSYLNKLIDQAKDQEALIKTLENRLANKAYIARAPKKLVEETKTQLKEEESRLETMQAELKTFEKSLR
ncbi:valine--tRNA ligase [Candidatus Saccharibacteria bacterium]|nr:valine--tRNA ligase [Candidatus Saccharibacteria bacterium]